MKWTQFSGSFSFLRNWVLFRTGSYSGFPSAPCYEQDTYHQGNDLANKKADSAQDCQAMCQDYEGCNYWTFDASYIHTDDKRCWIKSSGTGPNTLINNQSGPKYGCV